MIDEKNLAGLYLHSSCGGCDFGKILKHHKDDNGVDVIDIEVYDFNDLLSLHCDPSDEEERFKSYSTQAVLPEGVNVILLRVGYILTHFKDENVTLIEINNNADGCYRCVKSFILHEEKSNY